MELTVNKMTIGAHSFGNSFQGRVYFWANGIKLSFFEECVNISTTKNDALKQARKLKTRIMGETLSVETSPFEGWEVPVIRR